MNSAIARWVKLLNSGAIGAAVSQSDRDRFSATKESELSIIRK